MQKLNPDFLEFIRLLDAHEVRYLIVGGYAVAFHGFPRYTGDIDFFVAMETENAKRLVRVFEAFGFGDIGIRESDFLTEAQVVEIGREPRKIQIFTSIDGVRFDACYANRIEMEHEGLALRFIGKDDLILNKAASGRPKDRLDIEELQQG
jgi:hypothetical protein